MRGGAHRKIAIVGGGPAGLAAAFELTKPGLVPGECVTVYQAGWRLGGKCASGRDEKRGSSSMGCISGSATTRTRFVCCARSTRSCPGAASLSGLARHLSARAIHADRRRALDDNGRFFPSCGQAGEEAPATAAGRSSGTASPAS